MSVDVPLQKKTYNLYQNPARKYVGSYYAIKASGGFSMYKDSYTVQMTPISSIGKYDLTDAVQILLDADVLNSKLGQFSVHRNEWSNRNIVLDAGILLGMSEGDVLSLGAFFEIYDDYLAHVNDRCPNRHRGSSLFHADSQAEINGMDPANFLRLLQSQRIDSAGRSVPALSGFLRLTDIPAMLSQINAHNIFGNRPEPDVSVGFLPGDVIYLHGGIELSLDTAFSVDMGMLQILQMELGTMSTSVGSVDLSKNYQIPLAIRCV
jgi:hypothetical protein